MDSSSAVIDSRVRSSQIIAISRSVRFMVKNLPEVLP